MNHRTTAFALAALLLAGSAWAHHNMSALFDFKDRVTLTGTLTKMDWRNPHIFVYVDAKMGDKVQPWSIEGPPPNFFRTRDINKVDVEQSIGKVVTAEVSRARDGSNAGLLRISCWLTGRWCRHVRKIVEFDTRMRHPSPGAAPKRGSASARSGRTSSGDLANHGNAITPADRVRSAGANDWCRRTSRPLQPARLFAGRETNGGDQAGSRQRDERSVGHRCRVGKGHSDHVQPTPRGRELTGMVTRRKPGRVCRTTCGLLRSLSKGVKRPGHGRTSLQELGANDAHRLVSGRAPSDVLLDRSFGRRSLRLAPRTYRESGSRSRSFAASRKCRVRVSRRTTGS